MEIELHVQKPCGGKEINTCLELCQALHVYFSLNPLNNPVSSLLSYAHAVHAQLSKTLACLFLSSIL